MSMGKQRVHTQMLSPRWRAKRSTAFSSSVPQRKQVIPSPLAFFSARFFSAAWGSKGGASRSSMVKAPTGQTARHTPAPSQSSSRKTLAFPFTISMAPSAQGVTQRPHPVQSSSSIRTILRFKDLHPFLPLPSYPAPIVPRFSRGVSDVHQRFL